MLRGPQGTLYGRNAVGGSINLITAKPTEELAGYARVTYGNYNNIIAEAAIGGQLIPGIRARLAVRTENRDGFGRNPISGADVDDLNRRMVRLQLAFDLGPRVDFLLSGEYFRQNDSSGAVHYLRASFPGVARLAPLGVGGYATAPRDLATESQPGTDTETYSITGTLHATLTDTLSLTNITNYRRFRSSLYQDLDLSAVIDSFPSNGQSTTVQERRIDSKQFSNEFQVNYNSDLMNAVVAAYYFNERQRPIDNVGLQRRNGLATNIGILQRDGIDLNTAYDLCGYGPGTVGGPVIAPKRVCTHSNLGDDTFAVFGQTEIKLGAVSDALEGVSLKLGGRWSTEHVSSENPGIVIRYSATAPNNALPTLIYTAAGTHRERTFKDFTPEAGISWTPRRDILFYYTYSEGFKAGSPENASGSTTIVDPEKVANHEIGVKATVARGLTANLALYTYTLTGLQLNKTISGGPTGYTTIFQNAASTKAKGFEFELFARPAQSVRLNAAVSYTDAHFADYSTLDPLNPVNVTGGTPYNAVTNPDPTAYGAPGRRQHPARRERRAQQSALGVERPWRMGPARPCARPDHVSGRRVLQEPDVFQRVPARDRKLGALCDGRHVAGVPHRQPQGEGRGLRQEHVRCVPPVEHVRTRHRPPARRHLSAATNLWGDGRLYLLTNGMAGLRFDTRRLQPRHTRNECRDVRWCWSRVQVSSLGRGARVL